MPYRDNLHKPMQDAHDNIIKWDEAGIEVLSQLVKRLQPLN